MDSLDRLFRRLAETVRRAGPDASPLLTIADVYQTLVPYRGVRVELGFSELKEYEHALLRLLAGERGYVAVRPQEVVDEFNRELRSPNPILGIYRDYAGAEVELDLAGVDRIGLVPPTPAPAPAPAQRPAAAPGTGTEELPAPAPEAADVTLAAPRRIAACWHCREPIPSDREVRFCPHCGTTQVPVPCTQCEAPLEPRWKFCVLCGTRRPAPAAASRPS